MPIKQPQSIHYDTEALDVSTNQPAADFKEFFTLPSKRQTRDNFERKILSKNCSTSYFDRSCLESESKIVSLRRLDSVLERSRSDE